jgi:AGZA family xanthine/uracil permease-like MFS transporter
MMARGLSEINWEDVTDYVPAVVTALAMPLTFSIATGIGIGFITYAAFKVLSGRWSEATPAILILTGAFVLKFAFL